MSETLSEYIPYTGPKSDEFADIWKTAGYGANVYVPGTQQPTQLAETLPLANADAMKRQAELITKFGEGIYNAQAEDLNRNASNNEVSPRAVEAAIITGSAAVASLVESSEQFSRQY